MDMEKAILERENYALRGIVRAQALIIKEICELLPPKFLELENLQRAIGTSKTILEELGEHLNVNETH
jgi:hypothetical protein